MATVNERNHQSRADMFDYMDSVDRRKLLLLIETQLKELQVPYDKTLVTNKIVDR